MKIKNINIKKILIAAGLVIGVVFFFNEIFGESIIRKMFNPVLKGTSGVTDQVVGFIDGKYIHDEKDARIRELEEENARLRRQLIENVINENDLKELNDLKKMLNHQAEEIYDSHITVDLIAKGASDFYTSFLISAGTDSGVKKGDLVLSGNGLAGVVQSVEKDYSKVLSILDSQISVAFKTVRSDAVSGIASQNIDSDSFDEMPQGMLRGYVFDNGEVLVGDILMTSGMGIYPAGIEIGEVHEVIQDNSNLLKYVIIKPYTNYNELSKLLVINTRVLD